MCTVVHGQSTVLLPDGVKSLLQKADFDESSLGVIVVRASDGAVHLSHQATRPLQPASALKPLTAIVALDTLGPAFRGRTELRTAAVVEAGILQGDLVLSGQGDVDMDTAALGRMLATLYDQGVREIRGDVIIDRSYFQPARTDLEAPPFDETPEFQYNVIPDALLLNTNLVDLQFTSTDNSITGRLSPALQGVSLEVNLTLVPRNCADWEDGWKPPTVRTRAGDELTIVVNGDFPKNCAATTQINVLDRTAYGDRLFRALWTNVGGRLVGRVREGVGNASTRVLAMHASRSVAELMHPVLKHSDNPITRVLYAHLGARGAGEGTTAMRANLAVRAWLAQRGIDDTGLVLDNGSGLSRTERITPTQLAGALRSALDSKWSPEYLAGFPIVGVDGGMRRRLAGTPAVERSRLKTGSLRDVASLAGYAYDASGALCIVVAMVNHPRAKGEIARPILDALVEWTTTVAK
jgi:serine-type D-Ala-D-Ala carboxypeptidase/endopeptidase (penicillin-binding protein 4)